MSGSRRALALAASAAALLALAPVSAVADGATAKPAASPADGRRAPLPRGNVTIGVIRVVLSEQRVYVYDSRRRLVATLPASTGVDGSTPTGRFAVFSKSRSTFYRNDPRQRMRWMTRFATAPDGDNIGFHSVPYTVTGTGVATTAVPLGVEPSSKGCVRMRTRDAQWIYDNAGIGTTILVEETLPGSPASARVR